MATTTPRPLDIAGSGFAILQTDLHAHPDTYLASTPETVFWGYLPCESDAPRARVTSGSVITVDTLSHEGLMDDRGRDPVPFFASYGVPASAVPADAQDLASSSSPHEAGVAGPHIVTGPIAVTGARPGDLLAITVLSLSPACRTGWSPRATASAPCRERCPRPTGRP
jgi:hypothetical protein